MMEYYHGCLKQFAKESLANGTTPLHIYEDTAQKELVYVFTHPYEQSKLVKVVVHPNYKLNGKTTINAAKSWGIVSEESLGNPQFVLIK